MIYLDNAATSFPKPNSVITEVTRCLTKYAGNPGRSSHKLSVLAAEEIFSARETIADFFSTPDPECVCFTYNATYALNLAIKSLIRSNCHVITSDFEHNSVIRPLEELRKKYGVSLSTFTSGQNSEYDLKNKITPKTKAIVSSLASNVTGDRADIAMLSRIASEQNILLIIDASQSAGHEEINLSKTPCDAICVPGHKSLFGIMGSGFVIFKNKVRGEGLIQGGSGNDSKNLDMPSLLPEGYEAGTLGLPGIVSISEGIKYINRIGLEDIAQKLDTMTAALEERISSIKGIKLYKKGRGILSFNLSDIPSSVISYELDKFGICTRSGLHCAPSVHEKNGTSNQGAVRASLSYFNKTSHIDKLYRAMKQISMEY